MPAPTRKTARLLLATASVIVSRARVVSLDSSTSLVAALRCTLEQRISRCGEAEEEGRGGGGERERGELSAPLPLFVIAQAKSRRGNHIHLQNAISVWKSTAAEYWGERILAVAGVSCFAPLATLRQQRRAPSCFTEPARSSYDGCRASAPTDGAFGAIETSSPCEIDANPTDLTAKRAEHVGEKLRELPIEVQQFHTPPSAAQIQFRLSA